MLGLDKALGGLVKGVTAIASVGRLIGGVFKKLNPKKVESALKQAEGIVKYALPIVASIAAMTPGRTDDEIVAAADHYMFGDIDVLLYGTTEDALRNLTRFALSESLRSQLKTDLAEAKDHILNLAIELAYSAYKNG